MIFKSSNRTGKGLAAHLLNRHDNETVRLVRSHGLFVGDLYEAIQDLELLAAGSRCQRPLHHVSQNPGSSLSESDIQSVWRLYEKELDLTNHAYIEVEHRKPDGRAHRHRVYSRINLDTAKASEMSFSWMRAEKVARIAEYQLEGEPFTYGRHHKAVTKYLKQDGLTEIAAWMEHQQMEHTRRPSAARTHAEEQQQKRSGLLLTQIQNDLQRAWQQTDTGIGFLNFIIRLGYILAQGTKRKRPVVIDRAGIVHSPRRRLNLKAAEVNARLNQLCFEDLPSIDAVKKALTATEEGLNLRPAPYPAESSQVQQTLLERFLDRVSDTRA